MKTLNTIIITTVLVIIGLSAKSQMIGTLNLPGLGGGANANAATYAGDGVFVGATTLFSSKLNAAIGAVSWNTGVNILKAKYTVSIAQPHIMDGEFENGFYPVTVLSPLQLSWDLKETKLLFNYTYFWGQDLALNAHAFSIRTTHYLLDNNYSINGAFIYEYRIEKPGFGRELGDAVVLEANFSRHFKNSNTLGVFGYYNTNATPEYVNGKEVFNEKSSLAGCGIDGNMGFGNHFFVNGKMVLDLTPNEVLNANKLIVGLTYKF